MSEIAEYPRILIVEDDADQRQLIRETLCIHYGDPEGRNIVDVGTAAECLRQDLKGFDIVLQDYHLPDMNGLDLVGEILSRADLPVIFVTGENSSANAAEALRRGAQDYIVKLGDYLFAIPVVVDKNIRQHAIRRENARLQQDREAMLQELRGKNEQLEESMAKLKAAAQTDHLTGLSNRRRFSELLERYYGEAGRYQFDLTCCMCDLDHYKQLNDTLGHQLGDEILVTAARVIRSALRSSDIAARYGGDEFVLLLPHTSVDRGMAVAQRIRREFLTSCNQCSGLARPVTMSIGVASLVHNGAGSADALVAMADHALYEAKGRGKDQIVLFEDEKEATTLHK